MSINSKQKRDRKKAKSQRTKIQLPHAIHQLQIFRKQYVKSWGVNSAGHLAQGHYSWMAAKLDGYPLTLEIGCGVGHSTLALLKQGHRIVCVEENPNCIAATEHLVTEQGYSVEVVRRGSPQSVDDNSYRLVYRDVGEVAGADCLIIEGDALKDPKLVDWLLTQPKFDSIACWLIGTHNARGHNVAIDRSVIPTAFEHRIFVQNRVYEMADRILRPGGILSVIDRGQTPSSEFLAEALLDNHRDQASVTSLNVESLDHIPHEESQADGAIQMMLTLPANGLDEYAANGSSTISLCSITSVKP
ncbi:methyltransferase domain-containing protein [Pseudomonas viridiflava]|uniref:methyltransferase domain-containing protein n=1 Tax=Pseudomonas viridiflava TaxID=33069 RepID=UPI000F01B094|nr:class I SAM-dependent methyltransferase [Pseudomonas viridiflava]